MKKRFKRVIHFFGSFTRKNISTVEQAHKMGLIHDTNVFGDGINHNNCRSWWHDEYGNNFRCDSILVGGRDEVMAQIHKENPGLFIGKSKK